MIWKKLLRSHQFSRAFIINPMNLDSIHSSPYFILLSLYTFSHVSSIRHHVGCISLLHINQQKSAYITVPLICKKTKGLMSSKRQILLKGSCVSLYLFSSAIAEQLITLIQENPTFYLYFRNKKDVSSLSEYKYLKRRIPTRKNMVTFFFGPTNVI